MADTSPVQTFLESFSAGELERALSVLHDQVDVHEPAGLPTGGEYRGKQGFLEFLQKVGAIYQVQIHEARVFDAGDVSVARIDTTWTSLATGAQVRMKFCEVYTVENGLITDIDVYPQDTRALNDITVVAA